VFDEISNIEYDVNEQDESMLEEYREELVVVDDHRNCKWAFVRVLAR
jgi:hypothetical protein